MTDNWSSKKESKPENIPKKSEMNAQIGLI